MAEPLGLIHALKYVHEDYDHFADAWSVSTGKHSNGESYSLIIDSITENGSRIFENGVEAAAYVLERAVHTGDLSARDAIMRITEDWNRDDVDEPENTSFYDRLCKRLSKNENGLIVTVDTNNNLYPDVMLYEVLQDGIVIEDATPLDKDSRIFIPFSSIVHIQYTDNF